MNTNPRRSALLTYQGCSSMRQFVSSPGTVGSSQLTTSAAPGRVARCSKRATAMWISSYRLIGTIKESKVVTVGSSTDDSRPR